MKQEKGRALRLSLTAFGSITWALEIHTEMEKRVVIILGHHGVPRSQIVTSL